MDGSSRATAGAIRVLLADDSADFRGAARAYLRNVEGVELVGEAHDGYEALAQSRRLGPELVLMDVRMPRGNGIETATQIKALECRPVVVLFSVNADEHLLKAALAAGADDFFSKGEFVQNVEAAFERVMSRRTAATGRNMRNQGVDLDDANAIRCSLEWDWEEGHACAVAQEVNMVLSVIGANVTLAQERLEAGHAVHERLMQIKVACERATRLASKCAIGGRDALERAFDRALQSTWLAFQPIVRCGTRDTFAYEALLRSNDSALPDARALLDAGEALGRVAELGRIVRGQVAEAISAGGVTQVFVNLHPYELLDEELFSPDAPLSRIAHRIVLELTERARLEEVLDVKARVSRLRALGYRVAVDDAGAGYAGLTSIAQLEPEVVKIDMALVRGIDTEINKQRLVRALIALCREMDAFVVVEGVETTAERDTLLGLGADLLQGFLFGEPSPTFRKPCF